MSFKRFILIFFLQIVWSCNNEDNLPSNGFEVGEDTVILNNVFYFITNPDFGSQDFFLILTDGNVEEFSPVINDFAFSRETQNALILVGRKFFEEQIPFDEVPSGNYVFRNSSGVDGLISSRSFINCDALENGSLDNCSDSQNSILDEMIEGTLNIQKGPRASEYQITLTYELTSGHSTAGQYSGTINISPRILSVTY